MFTQSTAMRLVLCAGLFLSAAARHDAQTVPDSTKPRPGSFSVAAKVDRRVELPSIVARLAGYEEYVNNSFKLYADDVDGYFGKFKQHPAVQFAKKVRASKQIGFDAVMAMAVHLDAPPSLTPRVPFTDQSPDPRWGREAAEEFAKLSQQFYKDADYGPKVVHPDGAEDLYAIIGAWRVDAVGLPTYSDGNLSTIIHEYNHSFINHLVLEHERELSAASEKIFLAVGEKMKPLAYGRWQTALIESLVRTGEVRYKFEHEAQPQAAYDAIRSERGLGFIWIEELSALLGTCENSRALYPTLRSFFPVVVSYFADLSKRIAYLARRFDELSPRVASTSPFTNGAQDFDPNTTQIIFTFVRPLDTKGRYSFDWGPGGGEHFPHREAARLQRERHGLHHLGEAQARLGLLARRDGARLRDEGRLPAPALHFEVQNRKVVRDVISHKKSEA